MTLLRWREHPAARAELLDAIAWYDGQELGLGERLAEDIVAAIGFIRSWPDAARSYLGRRGSSQLHSRSLEVFPYAIIYFLRGEEIVVVAYAHERRRPGYWRERLTSL